MSEHNTCLNCGAAVTTNYCGHCGQKAATHRFTLKHFVAHDIIHGAFHLDKGFPYTLKHLVTKPGYSIRDYIDGKRVGHFNAITFLLIVIALNLFVQSATNYDLAKLTLVDTNATGLLEQAQHYQKAYIKQFYLITIPLASLIGYLVLRRSGLNFAEHLVLNTYKEGFVLLLNTMSILLLPAFDDVAGKIAIQSLFGLAANIWTVWYFIQIFRNDYKNNLLLALFLALFFIINAIVKGTLILGFIYFVIGFPE